MRDVALKTNRKFMKINSYQGEEECVLIFIIAQLFTTNQLNVSNVCM